MKLKPLSITAIVGAQFAVSALAADAPTTNSAEAQEIAELKQQIQALVQKVDSLEQQQKSQPASTPSAGYDALDQKVRVLEREREIDQEAAVALAKTQPKISLGANGFSFGSADTNFLIQLHGLVQADSRTFFNDGGVNGNDGFLVRRARPILTGTLFHDFDFNFTPDFGGSTVQIFDAYLNYRFNQALQLQAGKFKAPIGLENLQSDPNTAFNERSIVTGLVPNRDVGVELHGDLFDGAISYAVGIFNGDTDYNGTTVNTPLQDNKAGEGRVFFQPWKNTDVKALRGLGFGVAGSYLANHPPTNSVTGLTPGYTTDGQQRFFTYNAGVNASGAGWRVSPQAYYYYGPVGILGEYVISDQRVSSPTKSADLQNTAWQVSAGWLLTGEDASYGAITPRHSFDPRTGHWGALQLVGRFAKLDVDSQAFAGGFANSARSADGATAWSVGLNWYLNRNLRADLSFSHTTFDGFTGTAAPGIVPAQDENVLFTRIQLAF